MRARAALRDARHGAQRARRASTRPRTWSEIDVVQWTARQPGARAWYEVADEDLERRVRDRTVGRDDRGRARRPARRSSAADGDDGGRGRGRHHDHARRPAHRHRRAARRPGCSRAARTPAASRPAATPAALRRRSCSGGSRRDSALGAVGSAADAARLRILRPADPRRRGGGAAGRRRQPPARATWPSRCWRSSTCPRRWPPTRRSPRRSSCARRSAATRPRRAPSCSYAGTRPRRPPRTRAPS